MSERDKEAAKDKARERMREGDPSKEKGKQFIIYLSFVTLPQLTWKINC